MKFPSTEKKSKQLGMSYGGACHKLRQSIMFLLVKQSGRDICVRCGKTIDSVNELSIEHIRSWLDVDVSLFWDLDNIGFSHRRCNIPDRRGPAPFIGLRERRGVGGIRISFLSRSLLRARKLIMDFSRNAKSAALKDKRIDLGVRKIKRKIWCVGKDLNLQRLRRSFRVTAG